ncbi:hypothetical protein Q8A67_001553 [Cirrhinus molitorella]|uniref:Uncharacterized protein n=1 Tax=Cirrhinus molitorella TaxID=172907 RepID=A0AA88QRV4_9TELE|nr:hypothetical protein Q8A67_001553 [Cirrhinus molitorella]
MQDSLDMRMATCSQVYLFDRTLSSIFQLSSGVSSLNGKEIRIADYRNTPVSKHIVLQQFRRKQKFSLEYWHQFISADKHQIVRKS